MLKISFILANLIGCLSVCAEVDWLNKKATEIPYGIETLTHYRSEYSYRGFVLAKDTIDLQLGARYSYDNSTAIESATWLNSGIGEEKFTEQGVRVDLIKEVDALTYSISGSYRSYGNTFFQDGLNIEAAVFYQLNQFFELSSSLAYDTGAEGWYAEIEGNYYHRFNDHTYFDLSVGLSAVNTYYARNGLNDGYANLSVTYNINQSISLTPYIGGSVLLDSSDMDSNSLHAGIYFAVSF